MRTMLADVGTVDLPHIVSNVSDLAYLTEEIAEGGGNVDQCRQQLASNGDWWSQWLLTHLGLQPAQRQRFEAAVDDLRARHSSDYRLCRTVLPKWSRWQPRRRVTLCIGNDAYSGADALPNCVTDATSMRDMARMMRQRAGADGREILLEDASCAEMKHAVQKLTQDAIWIWPGSLVTVFFSGHGAQRDGTTYLLPISMPTASPEHYPVTAVSVDWILERLNGCLDVASLVFLDCCRDSPTDATFKAAVQAPRAAVRTKGGGERKLTDSQFLMGLACDPGTP
jgi:hypothetical protein